MTEKEYGVDINVDFWDVILEKQAIEAMDQVFNNHGSSFADEQNYYAAWLYFTGDRAVSGQYFPEAEDYPQFNPRSKSTSFDTSLVPTGMKVYRLPISEKGTYETNVLAEGQNGRFNHINDITISGTPTRFQSMQKISKSNDGDFLVVLTNSDENHNINIHYSITAGSPAAGPNPVVVKQNQAEITFDFIPPASTIRIFDVLGRRVRTLYHNGSNQIRWDIRDEYNRILPSSMYFYQIQASGFITTGKVVIVR
jgi:hypothetical protein